jgi:predicted DNA-binding transcriptional regulator AlpA
MLARCVHEACELTEHLRGLIERLRLNGDNEATSQPLRLSQVLEKTCTKKSTFYEMVRRGEFAKPYHVGRSSRWRQSDVDAWLRATNRPTEADKDTEVRA